nr:hypothetical protein [Tanacetum cinerariifolium]
TNEGEAPVERISTDSEEMSLEKKIELISHLVKYQDHYKKGEGSGTLTEPHHTPSQEAQPSSHTHISSPSIPTVTSVPTIPIPTVIPSETTPIRQYTRRARIAQSSALPPVADKPASPVRDVNQGEACLTDSGFIADQDRATIAKSSTLPHDLAPRVTSPAAVEGKKREGAATTNSRDDAPIKGRSMDEGEAVAERVSDDTKEMETVLTSMDATTVLASGTAEVPTGSRSIPTASPVFATATVVTPYRRRKGKEVMRRSEKIARDEEIARIHAEKELQIMIDGLDRSNEKKPKTKKQKRDFYMAVIRNNLGWKAKDFKGMSFEEVEAKFKTIWEQIEGGVSNIFEGEAAWLKRKGIRSEQESAKKQKISEEVPERVKSSDEVPEEKIKEMMQLVPIEEVYVEAL